MTIVVFDGKKMASDSLMIDGSRKSKKPFCKMYETEKYLIGAAGAIGQVQRIIRWIMGAEEELPHIPDNEEIMYEVMLVDRKTKDVFVFEGRTFDMIPSDKITAIGSGSPYAYGALSLMGRKPCAVKAVKAAIDCDMYCGGDIKTLKA